VAAGTGPLRQDSRNRSIYIDQTAWTGEPGQNRKDKSGHDSNTRTAASVQLGRKSQGRTAGTGQREKTVRTVHPEQETEDKIARTGQQGGQLGQDKGIGQP
jgi:hypothetical protein